ncbi:hypothetical protein PMSD_25990 [Paenibacillus macquariensis subsp. defensor]|nr:hypothetical protein PMSD_25990 [Paenibacillus macquariensis subsp. defensor]
MNDKITESQLEQMRHALGLNYSNEQTRNYFYTDANDPEWNDLVTKGYAIKRNGWDDESAYYYVSEEGKELVLAV